MRRLFDAFTVASAFVALQVVADTQYFYDQSNPNTYIAIVPYGETNEISSATVSILNENGVTNFVKRGTGSLISNKDISSYVGGIVIAEGVLRSEPSAKANETVGKLDGGGEIWVLDGATMELYTPSTTLYSTHMDGKTIHIAGRGFNGNGALAVCAGTADGASFGSKIILEDNALVCNDGCRGFTLVRNTGTLDFNNKTLHIGGTTWQSDGDALVRFVGNNAVFANVLRPGTVIVSEGYGTEFYSGDSGHKWNLWHEKSEMVLTNSSRLYMNGMYASNFKWNLKMHSGTGIQVANTKANWVSDTSYNYFTKGSVITLLDPAWNWIRLTHAKDHLYIKGKITGGGLRVNRYTAGTCGLYLDNSDNDFTNGVVVIGCSVHLLANGSLPPAGAALSLTNSAAIFHLTEQYSLPPLEANGNCIVSNYPGAASSGEWRGSITKSGSGTLQYRSLIGAPLLDARGGTVKILQSGEDGALPVFGSLGGTSSGTIDFDGKSYAVAGLEGSPNVVCPKLTVTSNWTIDAESLDAFDGVSVDGELEFGDGAVLTVHNKDIVEGGRRRHCVVATASGGIKGLPDCSANAQGWSFEKSTDGKSLVLHSPDVGLKFILR